MAFLKLITAAATAALLAGCAPLDLGNALAQALDPQKTLVAVGDVQEVEGTRVYEATFNSNFYRKSTGCIYSGVWVGYARTWDVKDETGRVIFAAEPEKLHGYALVLYGESCPPYQSKKKVLMVGTKPAPKLFGRGYVTLDDVAQKVSDFSDETLQRNTPEWGSQVLETLEKEKSSNEAAKKALEALSDSDKQYIRGTNDAS